MAKTLMEWQSYVDDTFDAHTPGGCMALVRGGAVELVRAHGVTRLEESTAIDRDTPMQLASISKAIFALVVLRLCGEGKLDLDATIDRYVPELEAYDDCTLRHVLSHTSVIPNVYGLLLFTYDIEKKLGRLPRDRYESRDMVKRIVGAKRSKKHRPGERMLYNNAAYDCLAVVIENVTGQQVTEVMRSVFDEWGMTSTGLHDGSIATEGHVKIWRTVDRYPPHPLDYPYGSGGVVSTLDDMLVLQRVLAEGRTGVPDELLEHAWTPTEMPSGKTLPYGLGWGLEGEGAAKLVWHNGGWRGFRSAFYWRPATDDAAIVLLNRDDVDPDKLALAMLGVSS
ncbi:MAG: serine hydrolase domain-containing protein [Acidobacteriota bacterium]